MKMPAGLISWEKLVVSFAWRALDSEELFLSNLDRMTTVRTLENWVRMTQRTFINDKDSHVKDAVKEFG